MRLETRNWIVLFPATGHICCQNWIWKYQKTVKYKDTKISKKCAIIYYQVIACDCSFCFKMYYISNYSTHWINYWSCPNDLLIKDKLIFTLVLKVLAQIQHPAYFLMIGGAFFLCTALGFFVLNLFNTPLNFEILTIRSMLTLSAKNLTQRLINYTTSIKRLHLDYIKNLFLFSGTQLLNFILPLHHFNNIRKLE